MKEEYQKIRPGFLFCLIFLVFAGVVLLTSFSRNEEGADLTQAQLRGGQVHNSTDIQYSPSQSITVVNNVTNVYPATVTRLDTQFPKGPTAAVEALPNEPETSLLEEYQQEQLQDLHTHTVATNKNFILSRGLGSVVGHISLTGTPPPEKQYPLDPSCGRLYEGKARPSTKFYAVSEDGSFGDVFVWVKSGISRKAHPVPQQPALLDQYNCEFIPYVMGLQAGQTLLVRNSDPLLHNDHITPNTQGNRESNFAQLPCSKDLRFAFDHEEMFVRVKCDVHQWMFAWIGVVDHPFYAVSDRKGQFQIHGLPSGNYVIEAFHRRIGRKEAEIIVRAGEDTRIDFVFTVADEKTETTAAALRK